MAKTHSKLKSATGKEPASQPNERFYTIGYMPQGTKPNPKPQLTIKGRWLEQIGFYVGCPVIIKIELGKLIVGLDLMIESIQ
ncbi:SymE family type I addiction module toxin [Gilliamella sp. wkB171]|uniref:SymE family type I addiction module toxin n=1 Tax=Gilliamella sp. wkB171 TaxID=3120258 RepID=UPI0008137EA7|nr:SymE family type I addiction module toxin [Gilliamella apicola]OCL15850.1 hypothetical protein A9G03_00675 [Gilliamella apicola]OCL21322.1 hypothetical protein A9G03_06220 [Gilliamella apicola]